MLKYFFFLLILSFALYSCGNQQSSFSSDVETSVNVQEIKPSSIYDSYTATGSVDPVNEVELANESEGEYYLQKNPRTGKLYKMGDEVRKGELIVKFENKEYEYSVNIKGAKVDLDIAKMTYDKQCALYDKGGVTLSEKVNAESDYISAQKSYETALLELQELSIKAPFSGVITNLPYYTQGVKIAADNTIVELMKYTSMVLDVSLPESQLSKVKEGLGVEITNYTIPDKVLTGEITEISPAIDEDTRTFSSRIIVDNSDEFLRPGMFVKAKIIITKKDSVIVIPKDVILSRSEGKAVFVASSRAAREKYIKTGIETEDSIEVVDGLDFDERLITSGYETLKNRSKIKIVK